MDREAWAAFGLLMVLFCSTVALVVLLLSWRAPYRSHPLVVSGRWVPTSGLLLP